MQPFAEIKTFEELHYRLSSHVESRYSSHLMCPYFGTRSPKNVQSSRSGPGIAKHVEATKRFAVANEKSKKMLLSDWSTFLLITFISNHSIALTTKVFCRVSLDK